jgi:PIN domain nuclease of toxin-antitoxin system
LSIGKLNLKNGLESFLELVIESGFIILPIDIKHTIIVSQLEFIHRDPFDRIIISQSKSENLPIITKDEKIKLYQVKIIW